jgi:DNA repair protein RadD
MRNGDFILAELARAIDKAPITSGAVSEILEHGKDRRSWLVFCTDLKHTEHVRDEIRSRGISCEMVSGETPTAERDRILNDFKAYRIRCVVNCQVLTTGFDHPGIDLIALLRNTRSPNLYVQIAGRGLRCIGGDIEASKRNGKSDCLWLDFTDTTETLGPVDKIKGRPEKPPKEKKGPPTKQCPKCQTINSAGSRYCVNCDYEFPVGEINLRDTASRAAILSTNDPVIGKYPVDDVIYTIHEKPGSPSSLRVMYTSGMKSFSEWICFEHEGWAKRKAASWWLERSGADFRVPATVSEAKERAGNLQIPAYIRVNESKKYPEVVGYEWSNHENPEPDTETANLERAHGGRGAIAPNTGL